MVANRGQVDSPVVRTWPVANLAVFVPMLLPWPYPVRRVFWVNGSTIGSNVDFGIYSADGRRIYSTGSTAQAGTSTLQFVTPGTEFLLSPGAYFFAWACSGTTNRSYGGANGAAGLRQSGVLQQSTALPLPATWTPELLAAVAYPLCGITRTLSGI